ncbi:hypothetical protein LIER_36486 [Lithospermum erythrorhizon]|uniref:Uncharacterized protein n=1 Tax=Lithospermum erythrorhizon TaxID=34254 RepID=A0AAV3P999_LITER
MDDFNESIWRLDILEHPFNEVEGNGLGVLSSKLKNVKTKLRDLNKQEFSNISYRAVEIQRDLEDKARVTWLEEGDASTAFFNSRHKVQTTKNTILSIKDRQENLLADYQKVNEEAMEFYKELFTAPRKDYVNYEEKLGENITKKIGANNVQALQAAITSVEIEKALMQMKEGKTPRPNGFLVEFYKHSWSLVKGEVFEDVKTFFAGSQIPMSLNSTTLVLIPKNDCLQNEGIHAYFML